LNQQSARTANPATRPTAHIGEHGIALDPPAYGIDLADRIPAKEDSATIQRSAAPPTTHDVAPGSPPPNRTGLPDALKSGVETLSGIALGDVRVHLNSPRPAQLQALAYTQGNEIHVAPGQARHLPHEAWHVVQQKQGRARATTQLKGGVAVNDDAGLEREADVMGRQAAQLQGAAHAPSPTPIAAAQDSDPLAVQRSASVRISAPIPTGGGSYKLLAGDGGQQVGSVTVHAKDSASIEVTDLGVDQAHRAQGIGKQLIASAARTGQHIGKARLTLAAQDNGSGRLTQWYKRMGFAQVGVHPSGYPQLEVPIGRLLGRVAQRQAMQAHKRPAVTLPNAPRRYRPPHAVRPLWLDAPVLQRMEQERKSPEDLIRKMDSFLTKVLNVIHKDSLFDTALDNLIYWYARGSFNNLTTEEFAQAVTKKMDELPPVSAPPKGKRPGLPEFMTCRKEFSYTLPECLGRGKLVFTPNLQHLSTKSTKWISGHALWKPFKTIYLVHAILAWEGNFDPKGPPTASHLTIRAANVQAHDILLRIPSSKPVEVRNLDALELSMASFSVGTGITNKNIWPQNLPQQEAEKVMAIMNSLEVKGWLLDLNRTVKDQAK
jgi:GNAT superfamily N-acetyltransferase